MDKRTQKVSGHYGHLRERQSYKNGQFSGHYGRPPPVGRYGHLHKKVI